MHPVLLKLLAGACFVSLMALSCATVARGTTYHVSPSGNDAHSGLTPEAAWRSLARVSRASLSAGDRILFEGGKIFFGTLAFDEHDHGTSEAPIEVGSYRLQEKGRARIHAGRGTGIHLQNAGGICIKDLMISGNGADLNLASGIAFYSTREAGASYVRMHNLRISGFGNHAISLGAWNTTRGFNDVHITHCRLHDNLRTGIMTWGPWGGGIFAHSELYIAHCYVYRMKGGSGINLSSVNGAVVEKSIVCYNGREFSGAAGIWAWDSNNVVFQFNESHHNQTIEADGDGFDFDGGVTNSVMQFNYSHHNDGAGFLLAQYRGAPQAMTNITIRHNISEDDCRNTSYGSIHVWSGDRPDRVGDIRVYNNTVFLSPSLGEEPSAISIVSPTGSIRVFNNLFITNGGDPLVSVIMGQHGVRFQNNAYWAQNDQFKVNWKDRTFTTLDSWLRAAPDQERFGADVLALNADAFLSITEAAGVMERSGSYLLPFYEFEPGSGLLRRGTNLGLGVYFGDFGDHFRVESFSPLSPPALGAMWRPGRSEPPPFVRLETVR